MLITPDVLLKLLLAVLAGGLIGAEREFRSFSPTRRWKSWSCERIAIGY